MKKDNFDVFIKVVFAIIGFLAVFVFTSLNSKVETMSQNISELNTNVALTLQKNEVISKKQDDHEQRIRKLESK